MIALDQVKHAVEIGAGDTHSSQLWAWPNLHRVERVELYEPNWLLYEDLVHPLPRSSISVVNAAVGSGEHRQPLVHMGYASYLLGEPSFLKTSCEPEAEQHWSPLIRGVDVLDMAEIDDGSIDYLVLTPSACEAELLAKMRSQPAVIRTKHFCHNAAHWTEMHKVVEWMKDNRYRGQIIDTNQYQTYMSVEWLKEGA